jgi:hypothetical protein
MFDALDERSDVYLGSGGTRRVWANPVVVQPQPAFGERAQNRVVPKRLVRTGLAAECGAPERRGLDRHIFLP